MLAERSAVLVEARSTVGPLTFGVMGLRGTIDTQLCGGAGLRRRGDAGHDRHPRRRAASGNEIYDAELRRRIDARRFPLVTLHLDGCAPGGAPDRYRVASDVTVHGVTVRLEGTVVVAQPGPGLLSITGEQVIDIRDFDITSPTVLMLRIYPDVVVKLYLEAEEVDAAGDDGEEG